jgi:thioredoxin 1
MKIFNVILVTFAFTLATLSATQTANASMQSRIDTDPPVSENLLFVKEKAKSQQREYIVLFTADWCLPCKWMESTTLKDERVTTLLNENYLLAKVDIDDFDGFAWKEYYNVGSLPTLLVFSPEGKLLARREESLSASQMIDWLNGTELSFGYLQFGVFSSEENATQQKSKIESILKIDVEIIRITSNTENSMFVVKSNTFNEPESKSSAIAVCNQHQLQYVVKN